MSERNKQDIQIDLCRLVVKLSDEIDKAKDKENNFEYEYTLRGVRSDVIEILTK